ncbi:MAG: RNA methyltransferase [Desulfobacterales bacterium]|nr:RNA methyltransferase [Desulfobacterales bacterium]
MMDHVTLQDHISIVLMQPRLPENIGAVARAMSNMGFKDLVVVNPKNFDLNRISTMATHEASSVVEHIRLFDNLNDALSTFHYTIGTTARLGRQRQERITPKQLGNHILPLAKENNIALLFFSVYRGLCNEDIDFCDILVNIPTAEFASLNLAQAVMVLCYELFTAATDFTSETFIPSLATRHELETMYEHLKDALLVIDFINPQNPDYWMKNFRRFFSRFQLRAKEVKLIMGICRQIHWYGGFRFQQGLNQHQQCVKYKE